MYNKEKEIIDLKIYIRFYITRMILRFLTVMFIFTAKQQQQQNQEKETIFTLLEKSARE